MGSFGEGLYFLSTQAEHPHVSIDRQEKELEPLRTSPGEISALPEQLTLLCAIPSPGSGSTRNERKRKKEKE